MKKILMKNIVRSQAINISFIIFWLLVFKKAFILLIAIYIIILNISNRLNISSKINRYIKTGKNRNDYYKGYYIKDINSFLALNDNEILIESIPNYSITKPVFSIKY